MNKDELIQLTNIIKVCNSASLNNTAVLYPNNTQSQQEAQPVIVINHPLFNAQILLQGAQLIQFTPKGEQPWLWLSPLANFDKGMAVRGGIPICFPWFGVHEEDNKKPKHGFLRQEAWTLTALTSHDDKVELVLRYDYNGQRKDLYPHAFTAEIRFVLSHDIDIQFHFKNLSEETAKFSYAFHTYFLVDDISKVAVNGLDGMKYLDNTDNLSEKHQTGELRFDREIDFVFAEASNAQGIDSNNPLVVTSSDNTSCIVWNPAETLALQMPDVLTHYRQFICVERGAVFDRALTIGSGQSHTTQMSIKKS